MSCLENSRRDADMGKKTTGFVGTNREEMRSAFSVLKEERTGDGNFGEEKVEFMDCDMGYEKGYEKLRLRREFEDIFGEELESGAQCSMCGDVGFSEQLLHCSYCNERTEHKYCSTSYRESGLNETSWACDWCWPLLRKETCLKSDEQESQKVPMVQEAHNGLDLLVQVAWGTSDANDLNESPENVLAAPDAKGVGQDSGQLKAGTTGASCTSSGKKMEGSPTKPSSRRRQGLGVGQDSRWSVTQKRACSRNNLETICARTGIQLERGNLAKGLGRRYRLLSSMLC